MNKIQEATLLLKKFGYRILRESTEGLDETIKCFFDEKRRYPFSFCFDF